MEKLAHFFIDDVIFVMRDLAKERPASLFDNAFMAMLKKAHDEHGLTVQLNLFYRMDFFYGSEDFTLADMPDCYKAEFEAASDWLRLAFHAKQEFPDYPYVNATYEDVKNDYEQLIGEVKRFAGEKSISNAFCPHWLPISKAGCQALADCGVRIICPTYGDRTPYTGDDSVLPYGHAARLLQNRQPETMLFTRGGANKAISASVSAYNHIEQADVDRMRYKNVSLLDKETGLRFRSLSGGPCLNLHTEKEVRDGLAKLIGNEFVGVATHEQYFYEHYYNYQPDYADKLFAMAEVLHNAGYRFVTTDELN